MRIQNAKLIVIPSSSQGELVTREGNHGSVLARRSFLTGLGSLLAAPAIVKASSLMPVKATLAPATIWYPAAADVKFLEGRSQCIAQTIYYGTEEGSRANVAAFYSIHLRLAA